MIMMCMSVSLRLLPVGVWNSCHLAEFMFSLRHVVSVAMLRCRVCCVFVYVCVCAGHTWNIPDSVMSLTLIAAGSSVPDAIASLIVVRDGMMPTLLLGHRVQ